MASDSPMPRERAMSKMGAAMAATPWPEEMKMFEPYVTAQLWFKEAPKLEAITAAFEKHAWPSHRFHSCIEDNTKWVRRHEAMDINYHFEEKVVEDEREIDKFTMDTQLSTLDASYPRWKVFVLRAKSGRSCAILHVHHAVGDGLGLLFALSPMIGVEGGNALATVPLPTSVLPASVRKAKEAAKRGSFAEDKSLMDPALTKAAVEATQAQEASQASASQASAAPAVSIFKMFDMGITTAIRMWSRGAFAPLMQGYDTDLSINEPLSKRKPVLTFSGNREFTRLPPVSMAAVSVVRKRHGVTMNDAVMAALTGALRRYAIEVNNDEVLKSGTAPVECKSLVMLALPRPIDESDMTSALCNNILFASQTIPIQEPSAKRRMELTVIGCNDLKSKPYMAGLVGFTKFITKMAPQALLNKAAGEAWSKHTVLVTNVPATSVPATWPAEGGMPIESISVCIANVMSQVSMISYNGNVYASIVADPALIGDTAKLGQFWLEEFDILAVA